MEWYEMKVHIKLGKKHTSKTIVKFSNYNTEETIQKNARKWRGTDCYMNEDFLNEKIRKQNCKNINFVFFVFVKRFLHSGK